MKYKISDFKNSMPEWKRKKDPFIGKIFYRPLSRPVSCVLANLGIQANTVSFISLLIGMAGCAFYMFNNHNCHIIGAIVILIWAVFDCVDGDIARTVRKQYFGEFADAVSCYFLLSFMNMAFAMSVYYEGGFFFPKQSALVFFFAGIASIADPLMRLVYHQFQQSLSEIPAEKDNNSLPQNGGKLWKILEIMSIGALLPFFIIAATLLKALDIIIIYHLVLNTSILLGVLMMSIVKVYKLNKLYHMK